MRSQSVRPASDLRALWSTSTASDALTQPSPLRSHGITFTNHVWIATETVPAQAMTRAAQASSR